MLPFSVYFVARVDPGLRLRLVVTALALLLALLLGLGLLELAGVDSFSAYAAMFRAAFSGGAFALNDTALKATPLMIAALACALAFRMGLWNIGAEGQLLLGAWAATAVASFVLPASTPAWLMLPMMALAAMLTGGLYAGLAGWLKARFDVSEILVTLMLVYVAVHWNNFWIFGPWSKNGFPLTPIFPASARLPRLSDAASIFSELSGLTLHLGFAIAIALAVLFYCLLRCTRFGWTIKVIGDSPKTAHYVGLDVVKMTVWVMFLSGALAGLAGMIELSGVVFRLQERFSPGYGFTAIIIAWLARLNPLAIVLVSLLLGGLLVGGREVQPAGIAQMLQGLLLFVIVASEFFVRYRLLVKWGTK